ncbi:MAG: hypothetical protein GY784_06980 [Gammaproteobacteria bacterium]|nr:hypothetical protein [Gammaproteobacteria bacterium]
MKALLVITLLFSASSATDPKISRAPDSYQVLSVGSNSCQVISANYEKEPYQFLMKIWISGYLSAINSTLQNNHISFGLADRQKIIEGVKEYCSEEINDGRSFAEYMDTYWRPIIQKELSMRN